MDAIKYFQEKNRLTKDCGIFCVDCKLNCQQRCGELEMNEPEKAVKIIEQWGKDCPEENYKNYFLKVFPRAKLTAEGYPHLCVEDAFGTPASCGNYNCCQCWDKPYREDK